MLWGVLHPNLSIYLKLINYSYKLYWALFSYNGEKYYITQNSTIPYYNTSFLYDNDFDHTNQLPEISNLIQVKKISSSFETSVDPSDLLMYEYQLNNNFFINDDFEEDLEDEDEKISYHILDEEEDEPAGVWVEDLFKYNTKMIVSRKRLELMKFFKSKITRQNRITGWISNKLKWKVKNILNSFDLFLLQALLNSRLILNKTTAGFLLKHGYVYVNGHPEVQSTFVLKKFDMVQLIFSPKYIDFYAQNFSYLFKNSGKFFNKITSKIIEDEEWDLDYFLYKKIETSKLFLKIIFFKQPILPYLEVDFTTMSFFIIYLPLGANYLLNKNYYFYNYYLNRFYNWKFRS